jgi:uncharacterized repeat protein (TIGR01451 family)
MADSTLGGGADRHADLVQEASVSALFVPRFRSRFAASVTALLLAAGFTVAAGGVAPAHADASPFQVTVTPSASTIASGQQLTYTVDVKNTGGDITTETTLNAQVQGMTGLVLTSNVGGCTQSANQVTCTAGILQGLQSWQVTIRGTVTAANGTSLNQGVTVTGNHTSNGYETTSYASVLVNNNASGPLPDLSTSVQAPSTVQDNTNATFQVTVNNSGNANATGITEIATLPDGFGYVSATGNSLFSCVNQPAGSRTVVCSGGRVNAGANATITIVGNANNQVAGSQLNFTAVVDPYDQIAESNELNNTGSSVPTSAPDPVQKQLTITKTGSPSVLRPGDQLTYTIVVTNIDPNRADNISMSDTTQGLDAASVKATTNRGVCTIAAAKVTCTQKSPTLRLDAAQTMNVQITGTVVASANSLITNVATVTGVIKNKAVTNTSATTTTVRPGVDLSVVQSAVNNHDDIPTTPGNDWFRAWDHFQYDVSVGNSGMDNATNVVLREVVAPGVKYLGHLDAVGNPEPDLSTSAVDCDQTTTGSPIVCTLATVNGSPTFGTTRNFSLVVVSPPGTGAITATATVDPGNAIFESDETNNVSTVTTPIDTGVDLTISKQSPEKVAPSGTLIYTIVVSNIGTQDATGVRIRDVLPTGTRFRSVHELIAAGDPGHNFTCSSDGSAFAGDVTCLGGNLRGTHDHNLPVDSATIELKTFAPASPGTIRNQVKVDPNGEIAELLETNNTNTFDTQIVIDGGCCAYQELNLTKTQVFPTDGSGNPTAVKPSGIVEYDLKVKNDGTQVAFDVAVQDVMPSGFSYRSATDTLPGTGAFQCGVSGQTITCTGGTLDGSDGQTALAGDTTRTIHVSLFASSQPGTYTNTATVDPANTIPEADETNNSATAVTTVALTGGGDYIDFKINSRQTSPGTDGTAVVPHGLLEYSLDVTNAGTAVAFNVKVRDVLPTGSQFRSATDTGPTTGNFNCSESGGTVTCVGGTLDGAAGPDETPSPSTRTIVIQVFAPTAIDTYHNTAMVDPDNTVAENDETNNTDQTDTDVRRGAGGTYQDLTVDSVTPSTTTPQPGQTYSYDVKVSNTGTNPAFNIKLANALDSGPTFVGATAGNGFNCSVTDSAVTCTGGVLDGSLDLDPASASTTVTLTVKAPMVDQFQYDLRSVIDPDNTIAESDEANNTGSATVKTVSQVDLTFQDSMSSTGSKGNSGTVTWTLHNTGSAAATNVTLVVNMSIGSIPQQMSQLPDNWSCQVEADPINKVTCHGDIAAGGSLDFKVDTFVTADNPISNGFVDPGNAIIESDETNNADQG